MTRNRKGRAGCNQATLKTSRHIRNFTGLVARIKAATIIFALGGLRPAAVPDWLIDRGGQRDV